MTFRKKIYKDIEMLQYDPDNRIDYYNNDRTHRGKMCSGRTPIGTLEDGKTICESPLHNFVFCPISALGKIFNPRNISNIPAVKNFSRLENEQNFLLCKGLCDEKMAA